MRSTCNSSDTESASSDTDSADEEITHESFGHEKYKRIGDGHASDSYIDSCQLIKATIFI